MKFAVPALKVVPERLIWPSPKRLEPQGGRGWSPLELFPLAVEAEWYPERGSEPQPRNRSLDYGTNRSRRRPTAHPSPLELLHPAAIRLSLAQCVVCRAGLRGPDSRRRSSPVGTAGAHPRLCFEKELGSGEMESLEESQVWLRPMPPERDKLVPLPALGRVLRECRLGSGASRRPERLGLPQALSMLPDSGRP
jgi:hypothetical protein